MEWVKSRDGTEARLVADGIEVRMIGKADSTVYKIKPANEPSLRKAYPALFAAPEPRVEPAKPAKAKKKR